MNEEKEQIEKNDPVCGMDLTGRAGIKEFLHRGQAFLFCSECCAGRFAKNPESFSGEPFARLENVRKTFWLGDAAVEVLKDFSMNIWRGDFVAIIGASGSGKSTALNMVGLLDRPTSGKIFLNGRNVSLLSDEERAGFRSKMFGFVFQQYNLIPWLTAYENVVLPAVFARKSVDRKKVEAGFHEVGLGGRMLHRPLELSGGEQQRVAILRSLVNDPEIILADEPTGNLDSSTGNRILEILVGLNKVQKKTLVVVTHDADIAGKADQVITIKDGQLVQNHQAHRKTYTE